MAGYRMAVCDDDTLQLSALSELVRNWAQAHGHELTIETYPSAEAFLFHYEAHRQIDMMLLDIEMGGMSGVDLARAIRRENREVQIIFITGYMEYIADGYEVEALHYLLKPVDPQKLFDVLDRAALKLKSNERALLIDVGDECVRIPLYEIFYIEVMRNYVTIHAHSDYTVKMPLGELEKKLDHRFLRTGRSFIVNLTAVRKVTKSEAILSNGSAVPIARGQHKIIHQAFIERL